MAKYQIDAEMLGETFNGSLGDLAEFVTILARQCERPESDFSLRQHITQDPEAEEPADHDWYAACEEFAEARPELFS